MLENGNTSILILYDVSIYDMNYTFFDLLALPLWIFLIVDAVYSLKKGDKNWRAIIRLLIGIVGLTADMIFVVFRPFG